MATMKNIRIAAERGASYEIDAVVFGDWAAHADHRGRRLPGRRNELTWGVTHVPSGRRAHQDVAIDMKTALAIAAALSVKVPPLPVILPSDPAPVIPAETVTLINATFFGALKSTDGSQSDVAQSPSSGHHA